MPVDNLKIENFASIKKADIDFAPLTIFVGPNSSGKSYVALLQHSLSNPFIESFKEQNYNISINSLKCLLKSGSGIFNEYNSSFIKYLNGNPDFNKVPFRFPMDKFQDLFCEGGGKLYVDAIEKNFKKIFTNNLASLNNVMFNEPFLIKLNDILLLRSDEISLMDSFFFADGYGGDNIIENIDVDGDYISITLNPVYLKLSKLDNEYVLGIIYGIICEKIILNLISDSYYLPASSYAISNELNSILSDEIKGNLNSSKLDQELMTLLLDNKNIGEGFFRDIAIDMSEELLGGVLQFNSIDNGIKLIDKTNDVEFKYNLLSSSIKELTPLFKYLTDISKKDDYLIMEEPENHLHPKNQRILVKYLVKLVNNGLNIILTTHSDYILEQFNNFIRLGEVNDDKLEKLGYLHENILDYHDVNIYNFQRESDYSYIPKKVDINETGFIDTNFSKITDELYDESVEIINAMKKED